MRSGYFTVLEPFRVLPIQSVGNIHQRASKSKTFKMVSNLLPLLLTLLVSSLGPVAVDADAGTTNKETQTQHYAITGVHTGVSAQSGARPARQNILVMQNDAYTLYVFFLHRDSDC